MSLWREKLRCDPIETLAGSQYEAVRYFTERDLLTEDVEHVSILWDLPEPRKLLRRQQEDGSWAYPGRNPERYPDVNYSLVETYKRLRLLVGKYGFDRSHSSIERAAEYVLSCQTEEGDIRGVYASQYHPHYDGVFLEYLIKAGYQDDTRGERCLAWLLSVRMDDGGWAHPMLTEGLSWDESTRLSTTSAPVIPFDRTRASCNLVTGMTLRAFACHPDYRHREEPREAGEHPKVAEALNWFATHQRGDGLWEDSYKKGAKRVDTERAREGRQWISLAICRVLKRIFRG